MTNRDENPQMAQLAKQLACARGTLASEITNAHRITSAINNAMRVALCRDAPATATRSRARMSEADARAARAAQFLTKLAVQKCVGLPSQRRWASAHST